MPFCVPIAPHMLFWDGSELFCSAFASSLSLLGMFASRDHGFRKVCSPTKLIADYLRYD